MKDSDVCFVGGTQDAVTKLQKDVKAEALAAEDTAAYNLGLIRGLEKRLDAQAVVIKAQSKLIDSVKDLLQAELAWKEDELDKRIKHLEIALANTRSDNADLVGLVERMGRTLNWSELEHGKTSQYPYTIPGQREYDAAMHDAEGPDVRREGCVP